MRLKYLFFCVLYFALSGDSEFLLAQDGVSDATLALQNLMDNNPVYGSDIARALGRRLGSLSQEGYSFYDVKAILKKEFEHSEPGPGEIITIIPSSYENGEQKYTIHTGTTHEEDEEVSTPKNRHFLLKVVFPVGITAVIFYLLYQHYRTMFQTMAPNSEITTFYSLFFGEEWSDYLLRVAEITTAVGRVYAIGVQPNEFVVDALRITNGLLFLINKKQFSSDAFKNGAYYSEAWLMYDVHHFVKAIFNDTISKSKLTDEKFENIGKVLCAYVLPLAESVSAIYLALNNGDTPVAKKDRLHIQSICSLARFLPIYLKEKRESIDVLFVVHVLATIAEFLRDFWLEQGNVGLGIYVNGNGDIGFQELNNIRNPQSDNFGAQQHENNLGHQQQSQQQSENVHNEQPVRQQANNQADQQPARHIFPAPVNPVNIVEEAHNQFQRALGRELPEVYVYDTGLIEAVATQVEQARNNGLEPLVVPLAGIEDLVNNAPPRGNQKLNDLIMRQIVYARAVDLEAV